LSCQVLPPGAQRPQSLSHEAVQPGPTQIGEPPIHDLSIEGVTELVVSGNDPIRELVESCRPDESLPLGKSFTQHLDPFAGGLAHKEKRSPTTLALFRICCSGALNWPNCSSSICCKVSGTTGETSSRATASAQDPASRSISFRLTMSCTMVAMNRALPSEWRW